MQDCTETEPLDLSAKVDQGAHPFNVGALEPTILTDKA